MRNMKKKTFAEIYNLNTIEKLAKLIPISYSKLVYYAYVKPEEDKYTTFKVPKRSGGIRKISSPIPPLKYIQRCLANYFIDYYGLRIPVHGFVNNRSIVTNAEIHVKKKYILNIDLKDFFPSINYGRIFGLLKAYPYDLPKEVAAIISRLVISENQLPQGAPTSPIISNMIAAKLDYRLLGYCKGNKIKYTRYADDLTFSTNKKPFSEKIIDRIITIINEEGFDVNFDKLRLQEGNVKKLVTGIKVNEKTNISRLYIRKIRAIIHSIEKDGMEVASKKYFMDYDRHRANKNSINFARSVRGKIEYIGMVRGKEDKVYNKLKNRFLNSID